jgi:glycosyltransferase involved in cell wall biosynthesis
MRRLLIDVTRTHQSGMHTGIQRVVRRLLDALQQCAPSLGVQVLPVVCEGARWLALSQLPPHPLEQRPHLHTQAGDTTIVQPQARDILLMADASWYIDPWPAVDAALACGVQLVGLVHDLFPVLQPEWFRQELPPRFARHLQAMLQRASLVLTPSVPVRDSLRGHISNHDPQRPDTLPVLSQMLGADFLAASATAATQPPELLPPGTRFFLSVGTIEPRKNHMQLLDAFEALWQSGGTDSLVLVGAPGWSNGHLLERLQNHPHIGGRLKWFTGVSDPQLHALYRQAQALVFLSINEGFGLPVAEATHLGCPVIANDIAVLREAGGGWPAYLNANDLSGLLAALRQPHAHRAAPAQASTLTWHQVALQVLDKLSTLHRAPLAPTRRDNPRPHAMPAHLPA